MQKSRRERQDDQRAEEGRKVDIPMMGTAILIMQIRALGRFLQCIGVCGKMKMEVKVSYICGRNNDWDVCSEGIL